MMLATRRGMFKYGLWIIAAILGMALFAVVVFFKTFDIFDTPSERLLSSQCDYEGLREAEVYSLDGNAVTNRSIHVSVRPGCNGYRTDAKTRVFTADDRSDHTQSVSIAWITFDTLLIKHHRALRIVTRLNSVVYADSTLNIYVKYQEMNEFSAHPDSSGYYYP